ncbi:hypothetical protein DEM27_00015 [Metarhizobium album]|uniref:Uncharacterized protein n=1 Tax=Metarhizobium album TaxID=2182425 RepID=A0A2U2DWF0_9HYPH|nr:hypothetical protein [Rhizobium album]PWE57637.1 hypothetical protein DEM27_00015 [Rhizobium album]
MRNKIEKRSPAIEIDEEAVKSAYLSGRRACDIALSYGKGRYQAVANYISANRQRWLEESRWQGLQSDETKIVIRRRVPTDSGGGIIMPISLPRVSMHVLAMQEAALS